MSGARLPAHVEVSALRRAAESAGGFAALLAKGERDAGVILILTLEKGAGARLWERMPTLDGARRFVVTRLEPTGEGAVTPESMADYLRRRTARDPDLWVVEVDIADAERFIADLDA